MHNRISRARAWCAIAAASLLSAAALVARTADAADHLEKELIIVDTGGAFQKALKEHFYDAFTKATGISVRPVAANNAEQWAKVKAMMKASMAEWDIVSAGENDLVSQRDFLARLDCTALASALQHGVAGACQEYGLLRTIGGDVIVYNTKAFPSGKHPRTWAEFWDVARFPGARAMPNVGFPWEVLAASLIADGVAADRLFPMDFDRAFRKLDQIKPHVRVWWKSGDQSQQVIRDGEVVLAMMWSGRALNLKGTGVPVEVEWNQGIKNVAYWGVLKNAPHPRAAMAFLDFFLHRPEAHVAFSRTIFYDTSSRTALQLLPETERTASATFDRNWQSMIGVSGHPWVVQNRDLILERWNAWIATR